MFIRRHFIYLMTSLMLVAFVSSVSFTTLAARKQSKEKAAAEKKHAKQKERARKTESPKAGKKRGSENEAATARHTRDRKGKKGKQAAGNERTPAKSKSRGRAADRRAAATEAKKSKSRDLKEEKAEKIKHPAEREERIVKAEKSVTGKRVVREQPETEAAPARKGKFGGKTERDETEAETSVTSFTIETTRAARESASPVAAVPDIIEVKEYDPARPGGDNSGVARRALRAFNHTATAPNVSSKRIEVSMEPERITEIQQALNQKGFYPGEPTGVWDDVTYDAMKRFQVSQRIDATGYPTAHALKRLGLTRW